MEASAVASRTATRAVSEPSVPTTISVYTARIVLAGAVARNYLRPSPARKKAKITLEASMSVVVAASGTVTFTNGRIANTVSITVKGDTTAHLRVVPAIISLS